MKYSHILALLLSFVFANGFGQQVKKSSSIIDSLKRSINKGNNTAQFKTLINLSD